MPRWMFALCVLVGLLVTGAGPAPTAGARSATPAASGDYAGLIEIEGGRKLWLECKGTGGPTVILEAGYRSPANVWTDDLVDSGSGRTMTLDGVAQFTRVCTYERPGAAGVIDGEFQPSRSDPVPQPRTAGSLVEELHALLVTADVPGPYVLVGHSLGGLMVRLYAATYPGEVVGMVLVDAWSEQLKSLLSPQEWEQYVAVNSLVAPELADYEAYETVNFAAASAEMSAAAAVHPLPDIPLTVIAHGQPFGLSREVLGFDPETLETAWRTAQDGLAALTPDGRFEIAESSAHYVQLEQPELVIAAIEAVVEAVRDPATWPGAVGARPVATPSS